MEVQILLQKSICALAGHVAPPALSTPTPSCLERGSNGVQEFCMLHQAHKMDPIRLQLMEDERQMHVR